jgi:membrane-bound metal-dependent hydrolase YbcI (DUF457 family)
MDPLTHLMAGALVGHAASAVCPEPAATLTALAAAIVPDFDFLARKYEGSRFLKVHHGITHSLVGIALQSLAVSIPAWLVFNHLPIMDYGSPSFFILGIISLVSVSSHVFLDWIMHNNGLPLFWPFSERRTCLPLILGVNPRTVSHDCGDKHYMTCFGCQSRGGFFNPISWILVLPAVLGFFAVKWRPALGIIPWFIAAAYLGLCYLLREKARQRAIKADPAMKHAHAYPARARPSRWLFVTQSDTRVKAILADSIYDTVFHTWEYSVRPLSPNVKSAVEMVENNLETVIRHLYPVEIPLSGGTIVEFRDLSYLSAEPMEIGTVRVWLDENNRIVKEIYQEIW